ncbi:MAG TPA: murein L,D-transpeptidase [Gammaproteobacteria bacterium]|nr:murein L,D-transpeptidase [Gammaproteobacteria bacterium]
MNDFPRLYAGGALVRLLLLFAALLVLPLPAGADDERLREQIQQRIDVIRAGRELVIGGESIASHQVVPALYEQRGYAPVWTRPESIQQLLKVLEHIDEDGLDPADYHLAALRAMGNASGRGAEDPTRRADYDILLSDSLVRLGYHLLVGKVDPQQLDSNWNMEYTIGNLDTALELASAIDNATVERLVDTLRPQQPLYARLKEALARYRAIAARGGWQPVPPGPALKAGMNDPRVTALRRRLAVTGELPADETGSTLFDDSLQAAVEKFQRNHGLEADGIAGARTLQALNVPVQARIDQIRANLERARWVMHKLPREFVLVDIAGFQVRYYRNGAPVWQSRAQVGKPYRRTPVFRSRITYMEINPTWTVPPTILREDILPRIRRDPDYLRDRNMRVIDRNGNTVAADSIDWSRVTARSFPYMIRQDPGPKNALGRIKFMFPNKHAVYLHDTPHRSLFGRNERAFSSGCIRVEKPWEFAVLLMNEPQWTRERILEIVDSNKTTRVSLPKPVTVVLLYWTVDVDDDGEVVFKEDIYDRDAPVIAALDQPFRFRKGAILDP